VPGIHIEDRPRFPWRGLMLDVSRHWMLVGVVERNLDAMAAVKLNVFHWHLSDDQGFRVESKRFPKLQQLSSDGNFYTQDEIRHVIGYARDRGIG
jgi:hexosaminidase